MQGERLSIHTSFSSPVYAKRLTLYLASLQPWPDSSHCSQMGYEPNTNPGKELIKYIATVSFLNIFSQSSLVALLDYQPHRARGRLLGPSWGTAVRVEDFAAGRMTAVA